MGLPFSVHDKIDVDSVGELVQYSHGNRCADIQMATGKVRDFQSVEIRTFRKSRVKEIKNLDKSRVLFQDA